jgi:hypothetical protein
MEEKGKNQKTEHRTLPAQTVAPGSAPAVKHAQQHRQLSTLEPRCQGRHQQQSKEVTPINGKKREKIREKTHQHHFDFDT